MPDSQRLPHTLGECKYPVVFLPQYRRKVLFVALRKEVGAVLRDRARQKSCRVEEGQLRPEHVHLVWSIPPKDAGATGVGSLKGKRALHLARPSRGKERKFTGERFWARGSFVSPVGGEEGKSRAYLRNQEQEEIRLDQLKLFK